VPATPRTAPFGGDVAPMAGTQRLGASFQFNQSRSSITMSSAIGSTGGSPIALNPPSPQANEPIAFTHHGHQYTVAYENDGGVSVRREDGITMLFNAEQAADLQGLPTEAALWGTVDAPGASFQGVPLKDLFSNALPSSAPATPGRLW
jgi:hypothetical protein